MVFIVLKSHTVSADVTGPPPCMSGGRPTPSFDSNNSNNSHARKQHPIKNVLVSMCVICCPGPRHCLLDRGLLPVCSCSKTLHKLKQRTFPGNCFKSNSLCRSCIRCELMAALFFPSQNSKYRHCTTPSKYFSYV